MTLIRSLYAVNFAALFFTMLTSYLVNKPDISHISASIERFGYKVIGKFQEIEIKSNDQDRYDMLMKYLNI